MCKPDNTILVADNTIDSNVKLVNNKSIETKVYHSENSIEYPAVVLEPTETGGIHRTDFYRSEDDEPHARRRKLILEKYPEIEKLFGSDSRPVPFVLSIVASQLYLGYLSKNWSTSFFFFIAWSYGGAASHALSLMTHELSHNLIFSNAKANDYFGIFCNLGMGLPSSTTFKRYHMEHHLFQGDREKDCDIPTAWEGHFFTNTLLKLIWLFLQPAFYALRPAIVRPKNMRFLDVMNLLIVAAFDVFLVYYTGSVSIVVYMVASTLLGMGLHPVAGHFISEHYVFDERYETYSYYGSLNWICWNVGYHNEHHDFPRVPGWRLPMVKQIAGEFYDHLPSHKSWTYVLWQYVTDDRISPFSRVIRTKKIAKSVFFDKTGVNSADVDATQAQSVAVTSSTSQSQLSDVNTSDSNNSSGRNTPIVTALPVKFVPVTALLPVAPVAAVVAAVPLKTKKNV